MVGFFKPNVAHSRLFGWGMPWVTIVDSKATTGFPWCNAFCTSSDISMTPVNSGKSFIFKVDKNMISKKTNGNGSCNSTAGLNYWIIIKNV